MNSQARKISKANKATKARNDANATRLEGKPHRFQIRPSSLRSKIRNFGVANSNKPYDSDVCLCGAPRRTH